MPREVHQRYIALTMEFRKEGDVWTGMCTELGTAADGDTFEEAVAALEEMVTLHLNTLEDVDECERFLKEHGVRIHNTKPRTPGRISVTNDPTRYVNRQYIPIGFC